MLVLLAAVATGAYAAVPETVYYREYAYGDSKLTYEDHSIASTDATEVTSSTTEWANGTYVVTATTTISSRITVTGTVNLIILDGAELTAQKGITVSNSNTLNIYMGNSSNSIQSTGKLTANAYRDDDWEGDNMEAGAGIGGWATNKNGDNYDNDGCGTVTIHGGTVLVNQSDENDNSAGIGNAGFVAKPGGNITIYYSHVTAYSNQYASAIGVGYALGGSGGTVAIYGGEVNAIVTNYPERNGINASLTVGKDVQVYALSGTQSPDVDLSGQTNVAPEGGGQVTTFNRSMFTRYTGPAPAPAVTGYSVSLKDGTEDASNWQGKVGEGEYLALPLEGVAAGTALSVKYSGTMKVKSVKAKKKQ